MSCDKQLKGVFIIAEEPVYLLFASPYVSPEKHDEISQRKFVIASNCGDPGSLNNDMGYDVAAQMFAYVGNGKDEICDACAFSLSGNDEPLLELVDVDRKVEDLHIAYERCMREGLFPIIVELKHVKVDISLE